jgi:hypothetical protein
VTIKTATITMNEAYVSQVTEAKVEIVKNQNSNPGTWQTKKCFELSFKSNYTASSDYQPFKLDSPPTCLKATEGLSVKCSLKPGSQDTIRFYFDSIVSDIAGFSSLTVYFTNFYTPYSSRNFKSITLKTFDDFECI